MTHHLTQAICSACGRKQGHEDACPVVRAEKAEARVAELEAAMVQVHAYLLGDSAESYDAALDIVSRITAGRPTASVGTDQTSGSREPSRAAAAAQDTNTTPAGGPEEAGTRTTHQVAGSSPAPGPLGRGDGMVSADAASAYSCPNCGAAQTPKLPSGMCTDMGACLARARAQRPSYDGPPMGTLSNADEEPERDACVHRSSEPLVRCWRCKHEVPESETVCNAGIGTQCKDAKACRGRWYGPQPRPSEAWPVPGDRVQVIRGGAFATVEQVDDNYDFPIVLRLDSGGTGGFKRAELRSAGATRQRPNEALPKGFRRCSCGGLVSTSPHGEHTCGPGLGAKAQAWLEKWVYTDEADGPNLREPLTRLLEEVSRPETALVDVDALPAEHPLRIEVRALRQLAEHADAWLKRQEAKDWPGTDRAFDKLNTAILAWRSAMRFVAKATPTGSTDRG